MVYQPEPTGLGDHGMHNCWQVFVQRNYEPSRSWGQEEALQGDGGSYQTHPPRSLGGCGGVLPHSQGHTQVQPGHILTDEAGQQTLKKAREALRFVTETITKLAKYADTFASLAAECLANDR